MRALAIAVSNSSTLAKSTSPDTATMGGWSSEATVMAKRACVMGLFEHRDGGAAGVAVNSTESTRALIGCSPWPRCPATLRPVSIAHCRTPSA